MTAEEEKISGGLKKLKIRCSEGRIYTAPHLKITNVPKLKRRDALLAAVQELEQDILERKRSSGIRYLGCGDNYGHVISGGSSMHILEHAISAVLDNHAEIDEQSIGLTVITGYDFRAGARIPTYIITISPPPSMSMEMAKDLVHKTIDAILVWMETDEPLDLQDF